MKAEARARANIALVKYWGKADTALNLPAVGSISITLDELVTETRVEFDPNFSADSFRLNGEPREDQRNRISDCLDHLRRQRGVDFGAQVESVNHFPTAAGLASSASGFAALAAAGAQALGLAMDPKALSVVARRGSGSAARSVFGGFVEMHRGQTGIADSSYAESLAAADQWPLQVVIAVTDLEEKPVPSSSGMGRSLLTGFFQPWVDGQDSDLNLARTAIEQRDFEKLADVSERSCLKMHGLMFASGLVYWRGATVEALHRVRALRAQGVPVFFTIDAGPQLKAVCSPDATDTVIDALQDVPGVIQTIRSGLGDGVETWSVD